MSKIFTTSEDVAEMAQSEFSKTGLDVLGATLRVMSVVKAKEIVKVSRASAATEFLTKDEDIVQMFIYEAALERFDEEDQKRFFEMALSVLSFDSDKGKLVIDSTPNAAVISMCKKYGNDFIEKVELQNLVIQQIEEEEKEAKAAAKEAKANKK